LTLSALPSLMRIDIAKGADNDGIEGWMDNYCSQNPLENIASAAENLVRTLVVRGAAP
jgi:hypothetical protein